MFFLKKKEKPREELEAADKKQTDAADSKLKAVRGEMGDNVMRRGIMLAARMEFPKLIKRLQEAGIKVTQANLVRNVNPSVLEMGGKVGITEDMFKVMAGEAMDKVGIKES